MPDFAAAYAVGISSNHPFIDGNKRTAMEVAFVFLEFNGFPVTATQEEAYTTFLSLAAGEISESELAIWLAEHTSAQ
jgi:death-on-curing protein